MTPKRRRWHRHRYFLTKEPVTSASADFEAKLQTAETDLLAENHESDFQPENQRQGEGQMMLKAMAAEAARL